MAKLTLIGMYNYDPTLFQSITFPDGIDKDLAINSILIRCSEFELLYPDLDFMKYQIPIWGQKHYRTFEKWVDALSVEYDPLHNYDRHEVYTDRENTSGSDSRTSNSSHDITNTNSGTVSDSTAAYDSTTLTPRTETENDLTNRDAGTSSITSGGTMTQNRGFNHTSHMYGNIGVTTSQQMLRDELEIQRFNIYENIADIFCDDFCIEVYI